MQFYFENPYTDPYFNMAVEEFLFLHYDEPVFHLWQNDTSVIVGKNQLLEAETDAGYAAENDIRVVRRFSGGGAVYQDLGNVNLSFIRSDNFFDFDHYNQRIMDFLSSKGLSPTTNERRGIFIDELKISGSSQHIRSTKSIYHATLLFNSNLEHLEQSLQGDENIDIGVKHVKSVRSPVTNLQDHFKEGYTLLDFKKDILKFFTNSNSKKIELSADNLKWIEHQKTTKYNNETWIREGRYKYL